jgi:hypothetical protein
VRGSPSRTINAGVPRHLRELVGRQPAPQASAAVHFGPLDERGAQSPVESIMPARVIALRWRLVQTAPNRTDGMLMPINTRMANTAQNTNPTRIAPMADPAPNLMAVQKVNSTSRSRSALAPADTFMS